MLMFWAFKLSLDEFFWLFWPPIPKIGQNFIQFSGHTVTNKKTLNRQQQTHMWLVTEILRRRRGWDDALARTEQV
jgi:hypothetical protein